MTGRKTASAAPLPPSDLRQMQVALVGGLNRSWLVTPRFSRAQLGTQLAYFEGISGWFWKLLNAREPLSDAALVLVPGGGIEPSTRGFSVRCSTD
jgi:hypothetical protein